MSIDVRRANLDTDRRLMIEMVHQCLTSQSDGTRFEWLYLNNPHGQARAWIALHSGQEKPIGMAAAFPRRILIQGHQVLGWVLGDFCIGDKHRSLGPALKLQRACLEGINSAASTFWYDFPSVGMMAVYRRLQISESVLMFRFAKPLRVDRKVKELISAPLVGQGLIAMGNLLLRLVDRVPLPARDLEFSLQRNLCGDEFTALGRRVACEWGNHIERSAAYLNWRFLSNPLARHEMLIVRRGERLLGYVVFVQTAEDGRVIDMFGETDLNVVRGLLQALLRLLRKRNVVTVSAPACRSHPWTKVLLEHGFRERESIPFIVHRAPHFTPSSNGTDLDTWGFATGDRDS